VGFGSDHLQRRSEDDQLSVKTASGHLLVARNMIGPHQTTGPARWVIRLERGVGETVPFLRRAGDGRREWRGHGSRAGVQVETHEAGWNPLLDGRALSPSPLRFSDDVRAVGLVLDAPPTLRRRQAVRVRSVAGGGRGGGRRRGSFGRIGWGGGESGVRRRAGGFRPLFPAAACVTVEVRGHAKAPAADLTRPGFFAGMDEHVLLERARTIEPLVARLAALHTHTPSARSSPRH